jgi:hypothetical protein
MAGRPARSTSERHQDQEATGTCVSEFMYWTNGRMVPCASCQLATCVSLYARRTGNWNPSWPSERTRRTAGLSNLLPLRVSTPLSIPLFSVGKLLAKGGKRPPVARYIISLSERFRKFCRNRFTSNYRLNFNTDQTWNFFWTRTICWNLNNLEIFGRIFMNLFSKSGFTMTHLYIFTNKKTLHTARSTWPKCTIKQ